MDAQELEAFKAEGVRKQTAYARERRQHYDEVVHPAIEARKTK